MKENISPTVYTRVEPLIQATLETLISRTHLAVPNTLFAYVKSLKSGQFTLSSAPRPRVSGLARFHWPYTYMYMFVLHNTLNLKTMIVFFSPHLWLPPAAGRGGAG